MQTSDQQTKPTKDSRFEKFFNAKDDGVWNAVIKVLALTAVIYAIESLSYFFVAEYFGARIGVTDTLNFQLPIDRVTPWFTPLFVVYIPLPFIWYFALPVVILAANGKNGFALYNVNALAMYIAGSIIYALAPTTTAPADFINGVIMTLSPDAPFYETIVSLSQSGDNIWGSFPSYHNYWAALLVMFALAPNVKWYYRYPMIAAGLLVSLSTLLLHQHCLLDVILTYALTGLFLAISIKRRLDAKLLGWFVKAKTRENH
jgi:hypothetical protein